MSNSNKSFNMITPQNKINLTSMNESNYNFNTIKDSKSSKVNLENSKKENKENIFNDYE